MNVADVGRALLRHPIWLVIGLVVAVVAGGATFSVVTPTQQSTASVVIVPPTSGQDVTGQNPLLNLDNTLAQLATVVSNALTAGAGRDALAEQGATAAYTVTNTTSDNPSFAQLSPQLVFTVTDPDAARATFTAERLIVAAGDELTALQERADVAADARATVVTVSEPSAATTAGDGQIRAGGGVGLLVLVLAAAAIVLLDATVTRRRRRKQLAADVRRPRIERPPVSPDTVDRDRGRAGS